MKDERWIVIPNWSKYHERTDRELPWMKVYYALFGRDDFRQLSLAERGLLVCLWCEYHRGKGVLRQSDVTRRIGVTTRQRHFDSLSRAGLIEIVAARPNELVDGVEEKRSRREPPNPPHSGGPNGRSRLTKKDLRKYTGCRLTRGSHSTGYIRDPLGTDKPPADWPHERPSPDEIRAALET